MKTKNYLVIICLMMVTFFMNFNYVKAIDPDLRDPNVSIHNPGTSNVTGDKVDCTDMLDEGLDDMLDTAYLVMRIAAIVLTILLGSLDFGKAVVSNDQDMLKKASKTFIKRLVAMAIIMILPSIIDPIVKMAVGTGTCGVG